MYCTYCTLEYQVFPILNIDEIFLMLYKPWLCVYEMKTVPTVMIVQWKQCETVIFPVSVKKLKQ